jgi:hypothetical protein
MTKAKRPKPITVVAKDPSQEEGKLRSIGGSKSDTFNNVLANQVVSSLWLKHADEDGRENLLSAAVAGLIGIAPKDELEGMLAAQMIAAHNAAMECHRRAMLSEQTFEGRKENLNQANKLSRTYTMLLDALNRHRGKGQQKVTVEHVHVHSGAQAIVGAVETGGGVAHGNQRQPHAKQLAHAPVAALRSEDETREPVPVAGDAEREMQNARR